MRWTLYAGSVLQAFGPAAAVAILWLYPRPALGVTATAGAFAALLAQVFLGFVYLAVAAGSGDGGAATFDAAADAASHRGVGVTVFAGVVIQCVFRMLLARGLLRADALFRTHSQVVYSSRFRLLPLGMALGFGFGLMAAALQAGTLLMGAFDVAGTDTHATYVDMRRCPQLPFLYWQAWNAFFSHALQTLWGGLTLVGLAAWSGILASAADTGGGVAARSAVNSAEGGDGDSAAPMRPLATPTKPPPGEASPLRAHPHSATRGASDGVFVPRVTSLRPRDGVGLVLVACIGHLVFAGVSLANTGAFDYAGLEPVPGRGCATSLAVHSVLLVATAACALTVARVDVVEKVDPVDI